ncbi:MAG: hypothetical protein AAF299_16670, partial [Pseudomonadota bacterium]
IAAMTRNLVTEAKEQWGIVIYLPSNWIFSTVFSSPQGAWMSVAYRQALRQYMPQRFVPHVAGSWVCHYMNISGTSALPADLMPVPQRWK